MLERDEIGVTMQSAVAGNTQKSSQITTIFVDVVIFYTL